MYELGTPQVSKGLFIAIMTQDGDQWRFTTFYLLVEAPPDSGAPGCTGALAVSGSPCSPLFGLLAGSVTWD